MELCEMEESFSLGKVYGQISIFSGVWEKKKKTAWKIFAFHLQTHIQSWLPSLPPQQLNSHSQQPFCQTSLPRICRVSERLRMRKLWVALKLTGAEFARKCYLKDQKYDLFYYCLLNSRPTQTFPQLHCTSCSTTMWHHLNTFNMATVTTGSEPEHSSLSFFREIKVESHTLSHTLTHTLSVQAPQKLLSNKETAECVREKIHQREEETNKLSKTETNAAPLSSDEAHTPWSENCLKSAVWLSGRSPEVTAEIQLLCVCCAQCSKRNSQIIMQLNPQLLTVVLQFGQSQWDSAVFRLQQEWFTAQFITGTLRQKPRLFVEVIYIIWYISYDYHVRNDRINNPEVPLSTAHTFV